MSSSFESFKEIIEGAPKKVKCELKCIKNSKSNIVTSCDWGVISTTKYIAIKYVTPNSETIGLYSFNEQTYFTTFFKAAMVGAIAASVVGSIALFTIGGATFSLSVEALKVAVAAFIEHANIIGTFAGCSGLVATLKLYMDRHQYCEAAIACCILRRIMSDLGIWKGDENT